MKKTLKIVALLAIFLMFTSVVFGATTAKSKATMSLVKDESATVEFGTYGKFTKRKTAIDLENKTIDITLTVENDAVPEEQEGKKAHIVFLLDSSNSMNQLEYNGELIAKNALLRIQSRELAQKLLNTGDVSIGIVDFSAAADKDQDGTDADATIITPTLTTDMTVIDSALETVRAHSTYVNGLNDTYCGRTDVEIGLKKAQQLLNNEHDDNAIDYVVLMTDGLPNQAEGLGLIGVGEDGNDTGYIMNYYTQAQFDQTKAKIQALKAAGIRVFSVLTAPSSDFLTASSEEAIRSKTSKEIADYIFGTEMNPTGHKVYNIQDSELATYLQTVVFEDLVPEQVDPKILTDVVIKDYFPDDIVNNFEYSLLRGMECKLDPNTKEIITSTVTEMTPAQLTNISAKVDTTDNSITWTFDTLPALTLYSVTYRLTLKDEFDSSILNKDLPTNKKVDIDYKEDGTPDKKTTTKTPVVKLVVPEDPTVAPKPVPQTGEASKVVGITSTIILALIMTYSFIGFKKKQ